MSSAHAIPQTQHAVQLTGRGELRLNRAKPVPRPGPTQILARVEATGLCFSDLKLLRQFASHARKAPIVSGLAPEILAGIPSYVPDDKPTVPGHETVCRIVAVGDRARRHRVGERCLVQSDYRMLRTAESNAAFGYNFEGGLQEYVLMDERVVIDPQTDQRYLIPVGEELAAAALCLVEPWACVEDSYVSPERRTIRAGGKLLVVADPDHEVAGLAEAFACEGKPASATAVCRTPSQSGALRKLGIPLDECDSVQSLPEAGFDDVVYFGVTAQTIELLNDRLAPRGIMNVVTGGRRIGRRVSIDVGRVHYGRCRWVGTFDLEAHHAYRTIPAGGELRPQERVLIIGAGGPMGQMHVIRDLCAGVPGLSITAADLDEARLESLRARTAELARTAGVSLHLVNPATEPDASGRFSYFVLTAPVAALVAEAIDRSLPDAVINIFAGIPAGTRHPLDLDTYIERHGFMLGTSGSVIRDMEIVLAKVQGGRLDTNRSVDAVSGMAGAIEGMSAVENRTLSGKIIVYPQLHDLGLVPLAELSRRLPSVAAKLRDGCWSRDAEEELLRVAH